MGLDMYLLRSKKNISTIQGEDIGYWRKANQIHSWFVDNVQGGEDDCEYHRVYKENLEDLRDTIERVLRSLQPTDDDNEDFTVAKQELPRSEGFCFGSQIYNEDYIEELEYTLSVIETALDTDFEVYNLYYQSSW